MSKQKSVKSGGRGYTIYERSNGSQAVYKNDGHFGGANTKLGETGSAKDSLDVIKSDSGAGDTNVKDA